MPRVRVSMNGILYELVTVGDLYTWKMVGYADSILMEEYLRAEIERGIKEYEEHKRSIPKGYTINFPANKKSRPAD